MTDQNNPPAITPEKIADLLNRLQGIYTVPVNDGAGLLDGKDAFTRTFSVPPINLEAAAVINKLHEENTSLSNLLKAAEITEQDNMQLREENTRLQAFLKTIADFIDYPSMSKWVSDDATEGEAILAGQVGGAYAILKGCKMYSVFEDENAQLQDILEKQRSALEFYADLNNYSDGKPMITIKNEIPEGEQIYTGGITFTGKITFTNADNGGVAREALKEQPK